MKKKGVLFAVLLMVLLTACGRNTYISQKEQSKENYHIDIRLSHVFAPSEQLTKSIKIACDNIRTRTQGAVNIMPYPQGQLPTYKDGLEQVAYGAKFISVEDPSYLGDYVPDFKVLVGPFMYSEIDQYTKLCETPTVEKMKKELEEKDHIKVLSLGYVFGFRDMMTNKEIRTPQDMKGLKIRVPGSQIFIDTINAMGATATPMAFGETIAAVQQGVVQGLEGTVDAMSNNGSAEVVKHVGLTKHFLGVCGVYINRDVFYSIPKEYQQIIQDEFDKQAKAMTELVKSNYDKQVKALEAKGIQFNEVDLKAFQKTADPVYAKMKGITPGIREQFAEEVSKMK